MKPLVCEYLLTHTLSQLEEDHGVKARFNVNYNRFSLNYNQLKIRPGDPLAEQCRGLILRPEIPITALSKEFQVVGETKVLAWPFNRFYNLHEVLAAPVDWSDPNLQIFEKLDGTMCVLYWDESKWCVATRSVPEADLPIHSDSIMVGTPQDLTYAKLFWRAWEETIHANCPNPPWSWMGDEPMGEGTGPTYIYPLSVEEQKLDKRITYVFELTTPLNRVVVDYDDYRVTLIGARLTETGQEINVAKIITDLPRPNSWAGFDEHKKLSDFVNNADPAKLEGAVVVDSQFRRVKVKNKAWVLSSKAKDLVTVSRKRAVEPILAGTMDDIIPMVEKDIADKLLELQEQVVAYLNYVDKNFHLFKSIANNRKEFAMTVMKSGDWPTPYFQLFDGRGEDALSWAQDLARTENLTPSALETILERAERFSSVAE